MGILDSAKRPVKIDLLHVENQSSAAVITYKCTYSGHAEKNVRKNVKSLYSSRIYAYGPRIVRAECLGSVSIGFLKSDVRLLFLVSLSDRTVDLVQEKEGSAACTKLLGLSACGEPAEDTPAAESVNGSRAVSLEEDLDIPIEILPNLYSLDVSNVSMKLHRRYEDGKIWLHYATLKCRVNYCLNGRKEGKRYIIVTGYDEKDGVAAIYGDTVKYHFTEAGHEFVEICFNDFGENPIYKIGISVREV